MCSKAIAPLRFWRHPPKPILKTAVFFSFCLFSRVHFVCFLVWEGAKSLGHVRLFCDTMDCSPLGSSVHGIFQGRILEWVARPSSGLRDLTHVSYLFCIGRQVFLPLEPPGKPHPHIFIHNQKQTIALNFKILKSKNNTEWNFPGTV